MNARISFRGWIMLASIGICVAVWWGLLYAFFAYRTEQACRAQQPSAPETCRQAHARPHK